MGENLEIYCSFLIMTEQSKQFSHFCTLTGK